MKALMRHPVVLDGRNVFEPDEMVALGFEHCGIGRPAPAPPSSPPGT